MASRLAFAGSILPLGAALALLPFLACSSFSGDTAVFEDDTYFVSSNTGALVSPEITTGADQSLVLAAAWSASDDHVPFEAGDGFTELARDERFFYLVEYELVGPGKHVATATFPPDLDWGMAVAGFRRMKAP